MSHLRRCAGSTFLAVIIVGLGICQTPERRQSGNARDPKPEEAIPAIITAFDTYRIVAISDVHGTKDVNDFILALVRHPRFPDTVNDIVVEWANSELQPTLDRYVAGEDVSDAD